METDNKTIIDTLAGHLQGYVKQMEGIGQPNIAIVMANEFNSIIALLRKRLPEKPDAGTPE